MAEIKKGDIVARKSYNKDVFFKVVNFFEQKNKKYALLKGLDLRLYASAPIEDLITVEQRELTEYWKKVMKRNNEQMERIFIRRSKDREKCFCRALKTANNEDKKKIEAFDKPGSVLHLDGDEDYLNLCMTSYKQMGVPAHGYHVPEHEQHKVVVQYLEKHRPDILVLTGHDGFVNRNKNYNDVENYHNSKKFIAAVKEARRYEKNMDDLIIFAGACMSHYEAILEAGANFASAPKRVLIHAYDPVFVVEKIAYTSIYDPIPLRDVIDGTITGFDGIGGFETTGIHSE
ncbi:MAG: sporulation peptidase YabG [Desulfotomaculum sp.]|nr:sporulation peptidase YabG [Desulfotomaculum sp.]